MKYSCPIYATYDIYRMENGKLFPSAEISGKAVKIIKGDSVEDCETNIKEFFKKNGFIILKDSKDANRNKQKI